MSTAESATPIIDVPTVDELNGDWRSRISPFEYKALGTALIRANMIIVSTVEKVLAESGLTYSRFVVLSLLEGRGEKGMPLKALSRATFLHPASLTYVIDKLEDRGLVRRVPSEEDRRSVTAEITDSGRKLISAAQSPLIDCHWGLSSLTAGEAYLGTTLLSKIMPMDKAEFQRIVETTDI